MKATFEYEYNIGDEVYHKTVDSERGIVVDVNFSLWTEKVQYEVAFGARSGDCIWCKPEELCTEKQYR